MAEIGEANRKHWDSIAKAQSYDSKRWQQALIRYVYGELEQHRDMFGLPKEVAGEKRPGRPPFRLLDYACGPGTVTRALLPYATQITGVDISENMAAEYNKRSGAVGTAAVAHAVQGNLLAEEPYVIDAATGEKDTNFEQKAEYNDFDAVIVGLGFHHFTDFAGSMDTLARRVKEGGIVGIVDLLPSEKHWAGVSQEAKKMMHTSGFTASEMASYMSEAGLADIQFVELPDPVVMVMKDGMEVERRVFFARGRKV